MTTDGGIPMDFDGIYTKTPEVDGVGLLDDLVEYFREYVRVGEDEYAVLATWVLHCHAFDAFSRTPYLNVTSPAPDCGKTQLLETAEHVLPRPMLVSSCTDAVLSRSIDQGHPTLMVDELDQLQAGDKDLLAAVLQTLNSGYKRSGKRYVLVPSKGGEWESKALSTFCPKILSGISSLPPTTKSRCIPIHMERLAPGDHVSDPDEYVIEPQAQKLKARAGTWATQHIVDLTHTRPNSPPSLRNRQREVARPLFAIADAAGGDWPERIRGAVVRLFASRDAAPADDIKTELLADIREVFDDQDRLASADLVKALGEIEDRPWATWSKGKIITQNQLARLLKDFKIYSGSIRLDGGRTPKGYKRQQFDPIWDRYLPHTDLQSATPPQPASTLNETHFSNRHKDGDVADVKCEKPASILACGGVAVQSPEWDGGATKSKVGEPKTLPSCPKCGSFALYQGECQTCAEAASTW